MYVVSFHLLRALEVPVMHVVVSSHLLWVHKVGLPLVPMVVSSRLIRAHRVATSDTRGCPSVFLDARDTCDTRGLSLVFLDARCSLDARSTSVQGVDAHGNSVQEDTRCTVGVLLAWPTSICMGPDW